MKRKLIAGNWKMNGGLAQNQPLVQAILAGMPAQACAVAVCVPAPYLAQVAELVRGSAIDLGAQDVSVHEQGAYTGEVSVSMLKDFGVRYAIVGHSERRQYHAETDEAVALKAQRALAADKVGLSDDKIGWFNFPVVAGGKGEASDTLGGVNGWLVTKGAPKEAAEFVKFFISDAVQKRLAQGNFLIPTFKGAEAGLGSPFMRNIAQNIAASKYHQNFYDQDLGPSVGRVVNDATAELAGGTMTPKQVAKAIQDAFKQGN